MDFKQIAQKRQKRRKEAGIYHVTEDDSKEKFYVLDMFPYPSGAGLHVGHPKGYIASDVVARKKMLEGYNVLHPMGFDTFGLGAENYAIKHKTTPQKATNQNIQTFISQLEKFGCTYDRDRMVSTADPKYYKWTQRIFLQLYHHYYDDDKNTARPISTLREDIQAGRVKIPSDLSLEEFLDTKRLAYVDEKPINRCPACKTGLANEDLEGGKCERCGSEIEQRPMKQRVLRITKYADRLIDDLELLEQWEHQHKEMQRNRIGRSTGTEIKMDVADQDDKEIAMFTTRIDTVFGATFVVLAPEHPLVDEITTSSQRQKVQAYQDQARHKTQLERTELTKEKTGVFTGGYAINPFNQERLPIRIADYVMMGYGTGAVMAVPAHDERDFAFAKKYDLPIRQVVVPQKIYSGQRGPRENVPTIQRKVVDIIVENEKGEFLLMKEQDGDKQHIHFVGGGIDTGYTEYETVAKELTEETGYVDFEILGPIQGTWHRTIGYRHTKQKNQDTMGRFFHVKLTSFKQIKSEIDEGRHTVHRYPKEEITNHITWTHHRDARSIFLHGMNIFTDKGILVNSPETTYTEGEKKIQKYLNKKMRDAPLEEPKSGIHNDTSANLSLGLHHIQNIPKIKRKRKKSFCLKEIFEEKTIKNKKIQISGRYLIAHFKTKSHKELVKRLEYSQTIIENLDKVIFLSDAVGICKIHNYYWFVIREKLSNGKYSLVTYYCSYSLSYKMKHIIHHDKKSSTNYNGHTSQEAIPQMQQRLQQQKKGGPKKQYKIQDRVFSRQRYRGEPFPIIWTEEKEKEK